MTTITNSSKISILRNEFERLILPEITKCTKKGNIEERKRIKTEKDMKKGGMRIKIKVKKNKKKKKILEIGCSTAKYKQYYHGDYIGMDLSDIEMNKKSNKQCLFVVGNGLSLPFKSQVFDIIICNFVIEHVYNIKQFIKETVRCLKSEGKLLISCPTKLGFRFENEPRYQGYDSSNIKKIIGNNYSIKNHEKWGGVISFVIMNIETNISRIIHRKNDDNEKNKEKVQNNNNNNNNRNNTIKKWNAETKLNAGNWFEVFFKIRGVILDLLSVIEIKTNIKNYFSLMNYFELKKK
tara:strand:- start:3948 stop:4829 length:882 start_codon:yes stop_codon:yes gene_type:complete